MIFPESVIALWNLKLLQRWTEQTENRKGRGTTGADNNFDDDWLFFRADILSASSFLNVRVCCFSLFHITLNWLSSVCKELFETLSWTLGNYDVVILTINSLFLKKQTNLPMNW